MNTGDLELDLAEAEFRVLRMQKKLHRWAVADPGRRFDDLANLVYDPAFLLVAWERVRGNKGARTAGVDGIAPRSVGLGVEGLLERLRHDLKANLFVPQRVREKAIPKASGKIRRLGIPTTADRVVQAALKLVLEPIFEVDFQPCSYGFRPKRRAQDAIAEIHHLATPARNYEWVFEADITACFDEIDHTALRERVRRRVGDKRVLGWVKAFLRAGVLTEHGHNRETITGTPQGGILSPLLANIALSGLDEHFAARWAALGPYWTRVKRRRAGAPVMKLVRYADDFVIMVAGKRSDAEALWDEVGTVLAPMGLRLSEEKTRVCHVDEGFDFLGWRIQRRAWRSRTGKKAVYTYPSKKALASIIDKVRTLTRRKRHRTLADLLRRLNPVLRGWCNYFRHGVSSRTFGYIDHFAVWRIVGWLRKRHLGLNMHTLVRRYLPGWQIRAGGVEMFRPESVAIERYRYRGSKIATPWSSTPTAGSPAQAE
ncbi:group II intron reverse transcriptase/maturase [Nocardia gamkensis]|uniref:Group II intron reverse transcriptase/maturase n=1 Tax=Nocardia gamkensis TaxID=352869 RepID=A0A7X6LCE1_9NOCA|nr:group II intron reverse transcriptase/maturase [Nocardia gamkensis]NKY31442.1 group II intron reverse transcriptase/maturase [Nocardia gamkensis]NQE72648.1 Group II intron-encoded protein LtrA [Nocardia gamkensis]